MSDKTRDQQLIEAVNDWFETYLAQTIQESIGSYDSVVIFTEEVDE